MVICCLALSQHFPFLLSNSNYAGSFSGITPNNVSAVYNELIYFSFVTLTSIGFGDILPQNDTARLTTAFFGFAGQFYMVVLVGIIVSKFTAK